MLAATVLMVRPARFGFDEETAATNAFQGSVEGDVHSLALAEFDQVVESLRTKIDVVVLNEPKDDAFPDSIFPNNWFSTHEDGRLCLYPMLTPLRRLEVRPSLLLPALIDSGFQISQLVSYVQQPPDSEVIALEGTGSLVLDRANGLAFVCESPRSNRDLAELWCAEFGYELVMFNLNDENGTPIYHTNVVLSVCPNIAFADERLISLEAVRVHLEANGRRVVWLSTDQVRRFGANVLGLRGRNGEPTVALSATAWESYTFDQRKLIESSFDSLVIVNIPTIEKVGGGGIRCMLSEIFLPSTS